MGNLDEVNTLAHENRGWGEGGVVWLSINDSVLYVHKLQNLIL